MTEIYATNSYDKSKTDVYTASHLLNGAVLKGLIGSLLEIKELSSIIWHDYFKKKKHLRRNKDSRIQKIAEEMLRK